MFMHEEQAFVAKKGSPRTEKDQEAFAAFKKLAESDGSSATESSFSFSRSDCQGAGGVFQIVKIRIWISDMGFAIWRVCFASSQIGV